jgi:hypothetical protein
MPRALAIAKQVWGGRVPIEGHSYQDGDSYKASDATHIKIDTWRAWMWRKIGILPYWISVRQARSGFVSTERHSFLEIGF